MERIIRSYAEKTFNQRQSSKMRGNQFHFGDHPPPKKGSNDGAIEPITKAYTDILTTQQPRGNYSQSLQRLIEQKPSILVYLVLFTSTFFLTFLMIWVWRGRIFEVAYPIDIEREETELQNNSISLNPLDNGQTLLENFMYSSSRQKAILVRQGIPTKIEEDMNYSQRVSIIDGKIKSNFPDIYFDSKNIFFYHLDVNLEQKSPMDNS